MLVFRFSRLSGRFEIAGSKGSPERPRGCYSPHIDISFTKGAFTVRMDLPGVTPDDLSIEAGENEISIVGLSGKSEAPGVCRLMERQSGAFLRTVKFPVRIEPDKVEANLSSGVLTLTVPAPDMTRDPTRIVICLEGAD
jgi:HSP20 family protein